MSGQPRIVTPQEAQEWLRDLGYEGCTANDLAHTVATEPDRIAAAERAAVVRCLRAKAQEFRDYDSGAEYPDFNGGHDYGVNHAGEELADFADAIENGGAAVSTEQPNAPGHVSRDCIDGDVPGEDCLCPPDPTDAQHAAQVRARLAAATPGPWARYYEDQCCADPCIERESGESYVFHGASGLSGSDAELIAHAPTDLARLLSRAERAEAALAVAQENVRRLRFSLEISHEGEDDYQRQRDEAEAALADAERRACWQPLPRRERVVTAEPGDDLAAIKAKHQHVSIDGVNCCAARDDHGHDANWPCLSWRLADRAERAERQVLEHAKIATIRVEVAERERNDAQGRYQALAAERDERLRERDEAQAKVRAAGELRRVTIEEADWVDADNLEAALAGPTLTVNSRPSRRERAQFDRARRDSLRGLHTVRTVKPGPGCPVAKIKNRAAKRGYPDLQEAACAALHASATWGVRLEPYQCPCGVWHLRGFDRGEVRRRTGFTG